VLRKLLTRSIELPSTSSTHFTSEFIPSLSPHHRQVTCGLTTSEGGKI
jgi:hypothetical protein